MTSGRSSVFPVLLRFTAVRVVCRSVSAAPDVDEVADLLADLAAGLVLWRSLWVPPGVVVTWDAPWLPGPGPPTPEV